MRRAVEGGHATLLEGKFPEGLVGKAKKEFFANSTPDRRDALIDKLVDALVNLLPEEKRQELADTLAK